MRRTDAQQKGMQQLIGSCTQTYLHNNLKTTDTPSIAKALKKIKTLHCKLNYHVKRQSVHICGVRKINMKALLRVIQ